MADTKLSDLPAASAIGDGDIMYIVQDGVSKKIPASDIGGAGGASENEYWTGQAAMLDPLAYAYTFGNSWSVTVPEGEVWYLREAWNACVGPSGETFFLRNPRTYMELPEGTTISSNGVDNGHVYICQPELVTADSRYSDAKGLYYDRLAAMRTLVLNILAGNATGGSGTSYTAFPTDFDYGMIVNAQNFDGSWVALSDPSHTTGLNLNDEINDTDRFRAAAGFGNLPLPFTRSVLPDFAVNPDSDSILPGSGSVLYLKLPTGF
jgi:hypothetical protein